MKNRPLSIALSTAILIFVSISASASQIINNSNTSNGAVIFNSATAESISKTVAEISATSGITPLNIQAKPQSAGGAIFFGAGETSALLSGYVAANGVIRYNLRAMANQIMILIVSSDTNSVALGLSDDRGRIYLNNAQRSVYYMTYNPQTGDYFIDIYGLETGGNFTFQVYIPARLSMAPGTSIVSQSGNIGSYAIVGYTVYAAQGQFAKVDLYSGAVPQAFLRVSGLSTGQVYLDFNIYSPSWYQTLPLTQDYLIEVISLQNSVNYTLSVDIK